MNFWYAFFVSFGVVLGTSYFFWKFWKIKMPDLTWLFILVIGVILVGTLGARLWTYLFSDVLWKEINKNNDFWQRLKIFFGFGPKGMRGLSVHGALIFGFFYCLGIFTWYSRKYQISLWICLDTIVKSTLIIQIVGRWGNFFNQELLGEIITSNYPNEYGWIPEWFGQKLKFVGDNSNGIIRQPLFLYESFANFVVLIVLIFIVPKLGIFFSEELKKHPTFIKVKWKKKQWQTLNNLWKNNICYPIIKRNANPQVRISTGKIGKLQILPFTKNKLYKQQEQKNYRENKWWKWIWLKLCLFFQRDSKEITNLYNPSKLKITRLGVVFFLYLLTYGCIRLFLQSLRYLNSTNNYNHPMEITDIVSIVFVIVGFLGIVFCQFIIPYKWRSQSWYYETWYYV